MQPKSQEKKKKLLGKTSPHFSEIMKEQLNITYSHSIPFLLERLASKREGNADNLS